MANIVVGMSGGVDSSVAAARLVEAGHRVTGLFMKNWEEDDRADYCAAAEDLADAESVCAQLGIELRTINFAHEYWTRVFEVFLAEYRRGRTPNPDVVCNREIKFKEFLDWAVRLGADCIATGHYARSEKRAGVYRLLKGRDRAKDQSYFLHMLNQTALGMSRFPLGEINKPEVRNIARELNLRTHDKKDSTGICFIGERRFDDFLSRYLPRNPGAIKTMQGETIGRHHGACYYTIGQRRGLGVGGPAMRGMSRPPMSRATSSLPRKGATIRRCSSAWRRRKTCTGLPAPRRRRRRFAAKRKRATANLTGIALSRASARASRASNSRSRNGRCAGPVHRVLRRRRLPRRRRHPRGLGLNSPARVMIAGAGPGLIKATTCLMIH